MIIQEAHDFAFQNVGLLAQKLGGCAHARCGDARFLRCIVHAVNVVIHFRHAASRALNAFRDLHGRRVLLGNRRRDLRGGLFQLADNRQDIMDAGHGR